MHNSFRSLVATGRAINGNAGNTPTAAFMYRLMIWSTNTHIGCATQKCGNSYFTSCFYKSFVNTIGANIYPLGQVCSQCPNGQCNTTEGLCSF
ncbi:hypothetical protein GCK32_018257 [Trichostrongylus colubriformis]|uniref:SCP domain-containing protein n=1 Tax=Trichostrongylus colubriformis TaxID=6319 RepID=A0AAN8FTD2_TRICO